MLMTKPHTKTSSPHLKMNKKELKARITDITVGIAMKERELRLLAKEKEQKKSAYSQLNQAVEALENEILDVKNDPEIVDLCKYRLLVGQRDVTLKFRADSLGSYISIDKKAEATRKTLIELQVLKNKLIQEFEA